MKTNTLRKLTERKSQNLKLKEQNNNQKLSQIASKHKEPEISYGFNNFLRVANEHINGDIGTPEGLVNRLKSWFKFTFNTTMNDPRLLDMTVEELLVEYQMHRIKKDPTIIHTELNIKPKEEDDFEEWVKREMGQDYLTHEQMVEGMQEEEKEFQEKVRKQYPDKVATDFSQFDEE